MGAHQPKEAGVIVLIQRWKARGTMERDHNAADNCQGFACLSFAAVDRVEFMGNFGSLVATYTI